MYGNEPQCEFNTADLCGKSVGHSNYHQTCLISSAGSRIKKGKSDQAAELMMWLSTRSDEVRHLEQSLSVCGALVPSNWPLIQELLGRPFFRDSRRNTESLRALLRKPVWFTSGK